MSDPKNIKKPNQGRVSRRDQLRLNPVPWIVLLILALILYFFLAHSKQQEWRTNKKSIKNFTEDNINFEKEKRELAVAVSDLKTEFNRQGDQILEKERALFPKEIDNKKIVKVLEIFLLRLQNIENKQGIRLKTLSVGQNSSQDSAIPGTAKRAVNFSVDIDQEELETLIWYLQNNKIPPRMVAAKDEGRFKTDLNDYIFLESPLQILPMMLIENINKSGGDRNQDGSTSSIVNVSISGNFYHQPPTENE